MGDDNRRGSDSVLFGMSAQIGQIQGKLDNALLSQEKINESLVQLHMKADERMTSLDSADPRKIGRVTDLENSRARAIAYLLAATVLGGGVGGTVQAWAEKALAAVKVIGP